VPKPFRAVYERNGGKRRETEGGNGGRIAIGRKNYLFAGSHDGAQTAAIIYSLLGTARLHKVNPYEWLKHVFEVMRDYPVNRIHELLPHNWGKTLTT
jgi:hypothetical protein